MRNVAIFAFSISVLVAFAGSANAAGDEKNGAALFAATCGVCHHIGAGAPNAPCPELNGIVGRAAASVADFPTYSEGMKKLGASGYTWTEEHIDAWIKEPKAMIPDSMMALAFPGEPDAQKRADIIAYLKTAK